MSEATFLDREPIKPLSLGSYVVIRLIRQVIFLRELIKLVKRPQDFKPSYTKIYSCRPRLKHRVFIPPNLRDEPSTLKKYPLLIEIHGGGFVAGTPSIDDEYCAMLSSRCGMIVVAIQYSMSPSSKYPGPLQDCISVSQAILADEELAIDSSNVFIGGMSAGGNLALTAVQSEKLRGLFKGMVIWYPITDFTASLSKRLEFRPRKDAPDVLVRNWKYIEAAYIGPSDNLEDPGLSPIFADSAWFPSFSFFCAAGDDILLYDTQRMAEKLARQQSRVDEVKDEKMTGWTAGKTSWTMIHDQVHGFNVTPKSKSREAYCSRDAMTDKANKRLTQWLLDVISENPSDTAVA